MGRCAVRTAVSWDPIDFLFPIDIPYSVTDDEHAPMWGIHKAGYAVVRSDLKEMHVTA